MNINSIGTPMPVIHCSRCRLDKEAVKNTAFYTGEVRDALKAHACEDCWKEWIKMQIMLINEYRLNLMDPRTDEFLSRQLLAFFNLDDTSKVADVQYVPPKEP